MRRTSRLVSVLTAVGLLGASAAIAQTTNVSRKVLQTLAGPVTVEEGPPTAVGDDVEIAYRVMSVDNLLGTTVPVPVAGGSLTTSPGWTYSARELQLWRERARGGPFRVGSDAWTNSPGDWQRITSEADDFLDDPTDGRWSGPRTPGTGCVRQNDPDPPDSPASRLRDAAFTHLVTGDDRYVDPVRDELLWHARQGGLDFTNASLWCEGEVDDVHPGFDLANWMTKLFLAYDYLGPDAFTSAEVDRLDAWFRSAGRWFQRELDQKLEKYYEVRTPAAHVFSKYADDRVSCTQVNWAGGPANCHIQRVYNNRRAVMARFATMVGVAYDDAAMKRAGKLFAVEWLKFSVFPDGTFGELHRWQDRLPDLGWAYANQVAGPVFTIAELLARHGDISLWTYQTVEGTSGSEGGPKSLLFAAQSLGKYIDGTYRRHATDGAPNGAETLIDGVHGSWDSVHDIVVVSPARWYADPYLTTVYQRSGPGMRPYPERPASVGPFSVFTGDWGVFPGVLFMYGNLESEPYPAGTSVGAR